jgi:ankyrin repeat protein
MSQADIDAFVDSAGWFGSLTPEGVIASVERGIPVSGRHSESGWTALHHAVSFRRRELVLALSAAGADASAKNPFGETSVRLCAADGTADLLQVLIESGGNVNEPRHNGETPLMALVLWNTGDIAALLDVLLARADLDLDATCEGKTAEQWAEETGYQDLAQAIAAERARRARWGGFRSTCIAATVAAAAPRAAFCDHTYISYDDEQT